MSKRAADDNSSPTTSTETTPLVPKNGSGGEGNDNGATAGGFSVKQTALLIAGEMVGCGVMALPRAVVRTGWVGPFLIVLLGVIAAFSGQRLSDCWSIIEERNPESKSRKRNPYAIIAEHSLGKKLSVVVSTAIIVTMFGAAVVYLLLASQIVAQLFLTLIPNITTCVWVLIIGAISTPLVLFGTPKDMSSVGLVAFGSIIIACVLYFIQMIIDIRPFVFRVGAHGFSEFFLAIGTMMFAFGGATAFPTMQNDMADRSKYSKSILISFLVVILLYVTIAVTGYAVYGEAVAPNLSASLSAAPLTVAGNIFMVIHLITASLLIIHPLCDEMEQLYEIPRDSVNYRALVRVSVMLGILFIGETIPKFYTILALLGGTTIALLTFVLPCVCYLNLVSQPKDGQAPAQVSGWMKIICWEVIVVGIIGGILAAISAITLIFGTGRAIPCYLR